MITKPLDDYNGIPTDGNPQPSEKTPKTPTSQEIEPIYSHSYNGLCPVCGNSITNEVETFFQNIPWMTFDAYFQKCPVCDWVSDIENG